jgi:RNA polymerase sigma-32 factor
MDIYRRTRITAPALGRETEIELADRWRRGDRQAGNRLVAGCLPFVTSIAFEYRLWGVPLEDVVQQGCIGLLRAVDKFDPEKECRLSTYAAYWIRAEIREYVARAYRVVRIGSSKAEMRALRAYRRSHDTDATALAAASGMDRDKLEWLLPLLAGPEASLDADANSCGPISARLAASSPSPEEEASTLESRGRAREAVARALGDLSERERVIVRERFMTEEPRTLQELGDELGVSKERVRQIEERVREKLRASLDDLRGQAA